MSSTLSTTPEVDELIITIKSLQNQIHRMELNNKALALELRQTKQTFSDFMKTTNISIENVEKFVVTMLINLHGSSPFENIWPDSDSSSAVDSEDVDWVNSDDDKADNVDSSDCSGDANVVNIDDSFALSQDVFDYEIVSDG